MAKWASMRSGAATQATASERLWVKASRSGAEALFTRAAVAA